VLVAELRRKLPELDDIDPRATDAVAQVRQLLKESKEDLLTADVFGVLKYLPTRPYMEAILRAIALRNPEASAYSRHLPVLLGDVDNSTFSFWPTFRTPDGLSGGSTEPDIVIETPSTFIVVEAKLGSGFGDQQVERELAIVMERAGNREGFLLLVTTSCAPHFGPRRRRLTLAQHLDNCMQLGLLPYELGTRLKGAAERVLWFDWVGILRELKNGISSDAEHQSSGFKTTELIRDLLAVAALRGIRVFEGLGWSLGGLTEEIGFVFEAAPGEADLSFSVGRAVAGPVLPIEWRVVMTKNSCVVDFSRVFAESIPNDGRLLLNRGFQ